MDRWKDKVAIVTGASSGIGAAIVEKLAYAGLIVVGLARGEGKLEELCKKLKNANLQFYPYVADVTKEVDVLNAFNWVVTTLGPIHILVNSAGIVKFTSLGEGTSKLWKEVFDTNVVGLCIATREAIKNMKEKNVDGHIVHINSLAGHKVIANAPIYSASKYSVSALTETLRQELNVLKSKIKISSISPGHVKTNMIVSAFSDGGADINNIKDFMSKIPGLQSGDIADCVIYILSTPVHVQVHELIIRPVGGLA